MDLTNIAAQFYNANTQEQRWLREEISDLHNLIGVIASIHGKIIVPKCSLKMGYEYTVTDAPELDSYVIEIKERDGHKIPT